MVSLLIKQFFILIIFTLIFSCFSAIDAGEKIHGLSIFGPSSLKYKEGEPFVYLNPDAPIAGKLRMPCGYFTKLTSFGLTGNSAPSVDLLCFESLGIKSWDDDEPFAVYGLLAEYFEVADDKKSMKIHLRKEARFADGKPVTADDVVFSYELLYDPDINPAKRLAWKNVEKLEKVDKYTVNLTLKEYSRDMLLWTGYLTIYPKHIYGDSSKNIGNDFQDARPVGSGPYRIESFVKGQQVTYVRRDDYWGKDLCYRKGMFNWKRVEYQIYHDTFAKMEALKSGYLDFIGWFDLEEFGKMNGAYIKNNYMVKKKFAITRAAAMKCLIFNLRKPLFQDKELRKVITSLYDFDFINKNFSYNSEERILSYFNNQPHLRANKGPAKGKVLELLKKLAKKYNKPEEDKILIPEEAFTRGPYELGTDSEGNRIPIDERIMAACKYLDQMGWVWDPEKDARVKNGKALKIEILTDNPSIFHFSQILKQAGIKAKCTKLSPLEMQNRLKNGQFDAVQGWFDGRKAPAWEMARNLMSSEADIKGASNRMGLKNPAVDEMLNVMMTSEDKDEVSIYAKAFDRVMCGHWYVLPLSWPKEDRAVYWNFLRGPDYYESGLWTYYNIFWFWWLDEERYKRIQEDMKTGTPFIEQPTGEVNGRKHK